MFSAINILSSCMCARGHLMDFRVESLALRWNIRYCSTHRSSWLDSRVLEVKTRQWEYYSIPLIFEKLCNERGLTIGVMLGNWFTDPWDSEMLPICQNIMISKVYNLFWCVCACGVCVRVCVFIHLSGKQTTLPLARKMIHWQTKKSAQFKQQVLSKL